jgi:CRP-like cAMP-binding protein
MSVPHSRSPNHLLNTLSEADFDLIGPHLEAIALETRYGVEEPNRPITQICFPETGVLSVVPSVLRDHPVEVGIVGREGMSGIPIIMGNDRSPNNVYVQIPGRGQLLSADRLRAAIEKSPSLHRLFLAFAHGFMTQTAQTAVANGRGKVEERLARWLLMAHDRLDGDQLPLTHEFLSMMLGVRRAGVTAGLQVLENKGLIGSTRGLISVIDRAGLEKTANDYYGLSEKEYQRLTGWNPDKRTFR